MIPALRRWRLGLVWAIVAALFLGIGCNPPPPTPPPPAPSKDKPTPKEQPNKETNPKPPQGERG